MQPKRIDSVLPAGIASIVHRVVVKQHLHFALQPLQWACSRVVRQPRLHVLTHHAVQRCGGQVGQHGPTNVPLQGAVPCDMQAIFLQKGLHGLQQLLRLFVTQVQVRRIGHHHLVHAHLPMAGGHPGLWLGTRVALL